MTKMEAIEIINNIRSSNSFTMGLSIDEYIRDFKKRWKMMYNENLETEIEVTIAILKK